MRPLHLKLGRAKQIIGGSLSAESKMPGTSYGLSASACITGAKLAKIPGTVCSTCYAMKDFYRTPNAQRAQARRLAAIDDPLWVDAMVRVLTHTHAAPIRVDLGAVGVRLQAKGGERFRYNEPGWHRWHSSGDLQSVAHLAKICEVAHRTPQIKHWLPTQELGMVMTYLRMGGIIPDNLIVRVSSIMIDDDTRRNWPHTSSVFRLHVPEGAHVCPAPQQQHRCMSCRACWSRDVAHVSYREH